MLRNHGLLTLGSRLRRRPMSCHLLVVDMLFFVVLQMPLHIVFCSIADAFVRMYFFDMACKIQVGCCPPSPSRHIPPFQSRITCRPPHTAPPQLDAQAAAGGSLAGLRMVGDDVLQGMDAVRPQLLVSWGD